MAYIRQGDTLVIWRLDRLGRSLNHLIETITGLNNQRHPAGSTRETVPTS